MNSHSGCILVAAVTFATVAGCAADAAFSPEEIDTVSEAVVGGTIVHGPALTPQGAVGLLCSNTGPSCCSGTLAVNANKVVTAAHCTCNGGTTSWRFFLPSQATIPANELGLSPNCFAVGDTVNNPTGRSVSAACWDGTAVRNPEFTCDDDLFDDSGSDIAVVTLNTGVGATATQSVPASLATPQPVYLGQNYQQFLFRFGIGFLDGFGAFAEGDFCSNNPPRVTEFIRRQLTIVPQYEDDPCDSTIEGTCHTRPIWIAQANELVHTGKGDSGGPLFAPAPAAGALPQIIGTLYGHRCVFDSDDNEIFAMTADPQTDLHKSRLGQNRVWLAGALGVSSDFNATQVLTEAALYATQSIKLNDRATVVPDNSIAKARVVATTNPASGPDSLIEIRNDVQTNDVISGGEVQLYDRVTINGNLSASLLTVVQGHQNILGTTKSDTVIMVANLITQLHFLPSTSDTAILLEPGSTAAPDPGSYGNVSVKSRAKLFLGAGVYIFKNFSTEPDAVVSFITPDQPTYIIVNGAFTWRASPIGTSALNANILWALRDGGVIERPFAGTILAPRAKVIVDTATTLPAVVGAILANQIEVHQGRQIRHRPFFQPWAPVLQ